MDERIKKWLFDIITSINEIDSYFENREKRFDLYKEDKILKRAVERNLEIIGEAVMRVFKKDPSIAIKNVKGIIGLRNLIIHAYDNISDENIWAIIINHLPVLKTEINNILNNDKTN